MDYEQALRTYLSTCSGKVLDVFYEIYQIIKEVDPDTQPKAIMCLLELMMSTNSDASHRVTKKYYTDVQRDRIMKKFQKKEAQRMISEEASAMAQVGAQPLEFYRSVWGKLRALCRSDREAAFALFLLVDNDLVPYRPVGIGISMSDEEYTAIAKRLHETSFPDSQYILRLHYEQKTQTASLLVDQLLSLKDRASQAVYMAMLIDEIEGNIKDRLRKRIEKA